MSLFFTIGIAQAILLIFFLLLKKENRLANGLLAFLLLLISFSLLLIYLYESGEIEHFPHLIGLDNANPFLIPPILYFYTLALSEKSFRLKLKDGLHLLPFFIYSIYVAIEFWSRDGAFKIHFLTGLRELGMPYDLLIASFLKILQGIIYLGLIYLLLKNHQRQISEEFSYQEKISLSWLKKIALSMVVIYAFRLIGVSLPLILPDLKPGFLEGLMEILNVFFIYLLAYFGLSQPSIFKKWDETKVQKEDSSISDKPKYLKSKLGQSESEQILERLQSYMLDSKAYLNAELSIKDVSDAMDLPQKILSQVINEQLEQNFFNFVNQYRVEEVKSKLKDPQQAQFTILALALESGFSSKSSFNNIFKKVTGLTPSSYKSSS